MEGTADCGVELLGLDDEATKEGLVTCSICTDESLALLTDEDGGLVLSSELISSCFKSLSVSDMLSSDELWF